MTDTPEAELTPLDQAHAAMEAAPEDDAARLRFYERLADNELFLMLTEEAKPETVSPHIFDLGEGEQVALVFDREERLSAFSPVPVPYVALSGRVIAAALAGQGIGLGVNLGVAPSSILLPPEALGWLSETLGHAPDEMEARIAEVHAPGKLPEVLLQGLDVKLAMAAGLAVSAVLAEVVYDSGARGHMLGFIDVKDGAEAPLAKAAGEALAFSGIDAGWMDVGFFAAESSVGAALLRRGLKVDLPEPEVQSPARVERIAPGSDPDKPPILR
ncbi:SseB family protein [Pseudooceanicola nanhaiensis]|uniref:SseB family protein n=1 Tax=Pseudooceanicola nanhaiensis TaxID=375761 RepID=UPI001CD1D202|nr:SseB family protein [Pseudooceanicola nanhaiensis]MCA0919446.1 SseB family protein [Pseudooceanicola nanhaiensis]